MTNSNIKFEAAQRSNSAMKSPRLLAFGNPLLDVTVQISDSELLKKYDIERNSQAEVPLDKLTNLFNDARNKYKTLRYSLGGSALNSCRILAGLNMRDLIFYGAIGNDQNGKVVKEILKKAGVKACLQELEIRTGTCVCLTHGSERSLVANIGAALKCEMEYVHKSIEQLSTDYYYIEGFFIPEKMDICRYLHGKFSQSPNTVFVTNLNAPYIVKNFQKDITWMVDKADIIFGNRDEFEELATINGFENMLGYLSELISKYTKSHRLKIIVITDGASPVILYEGNKNGLESTTVDVPQVHSDDIIDTTGAGDSFVAGFLMAHMRGDDVKKCIEFGCKISAAVIKTIGCNLPKGIEF